MIRKPSSSLVRRRLGFLLVGALLWAAAVGGSAADPFQPAGLFLSWQRDPTSTVTIDWHTLDDSREAVVEYRRRGVEQWLHLKGEQFPFPFSDRFINRAELTGLEPNTYYEFRFGAESPLYLFRTMPKTAHRPIRFAAGGDVQSRSEWMAATSRVAGSFDPDFMVFGGDLAYANGDPRRADRWYSYFENTRDAFRAPDGRLIPMVVAIGNHEVFSLHRLESEGLGAEDARRMWGLEQGDAPYFNAFFPMPGVPEYDVLDFGDYLSLILLDTGHRNEVGGEQTGWLASTLEARRHVPHVFPVYHVPAYPSVRSFEGTTSRLVRENWVPLFERFGVRIAFENHDHAYKRTYPIRDGRVADDGVVYIGDGAWGVGHRVIGRDHEEPAWYLKRAESLRHLILVTLHGPHHHLLMVDERWRVIDEYPETPKSPGPRPALHDSTADR